MVIELYNRYNINTKNLSKIHRHTHTHTHTHTHPNIKKGKVIFIRDS
jgi:hypothetical protein